MRRGSHPIAGAEHGRRAARMVVQGLGASLFLALAAVAAVDLLTDLRAGSTSLDLTFDVACTIAAIVAGAFFSWHVAEHWRRTRSLVRDLDRTREDAERWRVQSARLLPALGDGIRRQLRLWDLSADEQRIALLLLSGLSTKDIARTTSASPSSVRQDTLSIYRKSGVRGRTALSAYFIRDLLFLAGSSPRQSDDAPGA